MQNRSRVQQSHSNALLYVYQKNIFRLLFVLSKRISKLYLKEPVKEVQFKRTLEELLAEMQKCEESVQLSFKYSFALQMLREALKLGRGTVWEEDEEERREDTNLNSGVAPNSKSGENSQLQHLNTIKSNASVATPDFRLKKQLQREQHLATTPQREERTHKKNQAHEQGGSTPKSKENPQSSSAKTNKKYDLKPLQITPVTHQKSLTPARNKKNSPKNSRSPQQPSGHRFSLPLEGDAEDEGVQTSANRKREAVQKLNPLKASKLQQTYIENQQQYSHSNFHSSSPGSRSTQHRQARSQTQSETPMTPIRLDHSSVMRLLTDSQSSFFKGLSNSSVAERSRHTIFSNKLEQRLQHESKRFLNDFLLGELCNSSHLQVQIDSDDTGGSIYNLLRQECK